MIIETATMDTPAGPLTLIAENDAVIAAGFTPDATSLRARLSPRHRTADVVDRRELGDITAAVGSYFAGDVAAIDRLAVGQPGGPFITEAWQALRAIPAGTTLTYTQLAGRAGRPTAVRAAGSACARNLIAPIVPCHRALRSDGSLGGYYWGLPVKRWLLAHEARHAA
jgi:methylated-DNA-[protein]-cysteine S-methyltransferase